MAARWESCLSPRERGESDVVKVMLNMQTVVGHLTGGMTSLMHKIEEMSLDLNAIRQKVDHMDHHLGSQPLHMKALTEPNKTDTDEGLATEMVVIKETLKKLVTVEHHNVEILKNVEQGLGKLADRDKQTNTGGVSSDIASGVDVRIQLREELRTFQITLLKEFQTAQQQSQGQTKALSPDTLRSRLAESVIGIQHKDEVPEREATIELDFDEILTRDASARSLRGPTNGHGASNGVKLDTFPDLRPMPIPEGSREPGPDLESGPARKEVEASAESKKDDEAKELLKIAAEAQAAEDEEEEILRKQEHDEDHYPDMVLSDGGSLGSVFSYDGDVEVPPYDVVAFYYKTGHFQKVARSSFFENFTISVVIFNAVYIGFDSDYNDQQNIYNAHWIFQLCSQFFCVFFTYELVVRYLAFENKHNCLKDGWFKFDAFLVSTMILDTWLLMPTLYFVGGGVTIPTQPLRMLRLFKLTRMARLMKAFPELVTMIKGLVRSLRAISSSMILIGLMVYVWAILIHMLMKDEKAFNDGLWKDSMLGFSTITKCIWTLLLAGTLMLDNAAPLMTELLFSDQMHYIIAGLFFMLYALLSAMLILQMLIGVLCDVVSRVGQEERNAATIGLVKQEILEDLQKFDGGDGRISQVELFRVMNNAKSKALLKKLNINRAFLLELQKMMFTRPGTQVTIKAVLELMIMCRGDNVATVESMAGGLLSIIGEVTSIRDTLEKDIHTEVTAIKVTLEEDMRTMHREIHATICGHLHPSP